MRQMVTASLLTGMLCALTVLTGCETQAQSGLGGAALGAGIGAIIGNQSGHAGEGALIGGIIGGVSGLVVHDVKERRARDAYETAQVYEYEPSQGERLTFEQAWVEPRVANRGQLVEATSQYALLGSRGGVPVTETWLLQQNGQTLYELSSYTQSRNDGTWVSTLPFQVPSRLDSGTYTIVHSARTPRSSFAGSSTFTVR